MSTVVKLQLLVFALLSQSIVTIFTACSAQESLLLLQWPLQCSNDQAIPAKIEETYGTIVCRGYQLNVSDRRRIGTLFTAGCTVIDPCVSVCCMSLAGKSCASVDEPVRGWFNFTATRYRRDMRANKGRGLDPL